MNIRNFSHPINGKLSDFLVELHNSEWLILGIRRSVGRKEWNIRAIKKHYFYSLTPEQVERLERWEPIHANTSGNNQGNQSQPDGAAMDNQALGEEK
jgi:hypothetical protein